MPIEDLQSDVLIVAVTVGSTLEPSDVVVRAFRDGCRDRCVVPIQDRRMVTSRSVGLRPQDSFLLVFAGWHQ